jgi:hypothetical protein
MIRSNIFLIFITFLIFTGCSKSCESEHYEQADKGFTSEEIDGEDYDLPPQKSLEISITKDGFQPSAINALPQQPLTITIINNDDAAHSIAFELTAGVVNLGEEIPPGESKTMEFAAPRLLDNYPFYDPVDNNRESGFEGSLEVAVAEASNE